MIAPSVRGPDCRTRLADLTRPLVYVVSGTVAAAALGLTVGWCGTRLPPSLIEAGWAVVAATAGVHAAGGLLGIRISVPQRDWMIPSSWSWDGQLRYAITFGALLGTGFSTKITFIGYHLLLAICFLLQDPVVAALLMAVFGLARTVPVLALPAVALVRGACFDQRSASRAVDRVLALDRQTRWLRTPLVATTIVIAGRSLFQV